MALGGLVRVFGAGFAYWSVACFRETGRPHARDVVAWCVRMRVCPPRAEKLNRVGGWMGERGDAPHAGGADHGADTIS